MAEVQNLTTSSTRTFDVVNITSTELMDALLVGLQATVAGFPADVTLDANDIMQLRDGIGSAIISRGEAGFTSVHITETD